MAELAKRAVNDPDFRAEAVAFPDEATIDRWVRRHFLYTGEPFEIILDPRRILEEVHNYGYFQGDCDDAATLYAALFTARGRGVQLEAIRTPWDTAGFSHVYARTMPDGTVYDATVKPGTSYEFSEILIQAV